MRLSDKEKKAIREHIRHHDPSAKILLFGSRANDAEKGGDIDLLVESLVLDFNAKLEILAAIKAEIGDQKIDLVLSRNRFEDPDPFIKIISEQAIEI
jgi:predicted nucleotidyltransferase